MQCSRNHSRDSQAAFGTGGGKGYRDGLPPFAAIESRYCLLGESVGLICEGLPPFAVPMGRHAKP